MINYLPIILIVAFFILSFFVKWKRLGIIAPIICGACAAFFIVHAFIDDEKRPGNFIFAFLSLYLMVKYIRAARPRRELDERN